MVGPQYRPVGAPRRGASPVGALLVGGPCPLGAGLPARVLPASLWCACLTTTASLSLSPHPLVCMSLSPCLTGRALPCPCLSLSLSCLTSALPLPLLTQAAHCLPGRQCCPAHPGNSIVTVTNPSCRGERYQVAYQGDVSGPREPGPRSCLRRWHSGACLPGNPVPDEGRGHSEQHLQTRSDLQRKTNLGVGLVRHQSGV